MKKEEIAKNLFDMHDEMFAEFEKTFGDKPYEPVDREKVRAIVGRLLNETRFKPTRDFMRTFKK